MSTWVKVVFQKNFSGFCVWLKNFCHQHASPHATSTPPIWNKSQSRHSTKKWQTSKKYSSHKDTVENIKNWVGLVYVWFTSEHCTHHFSAEWASDNSAKSLKNLGVTLQRPPTPPPFQPLSSVIAWVLLTENIKDDRTGWGQFALSFIIWWKHRKICSNPVLLNLSTSAPHSDNMRTRWIYTHCLMATGRQTIRILHICALTSGSGPAPHFAQQTTLKPSLSSPLPLFTPYKTIIQKAPCCSHLQINSLIKHYIREALYSLQNAFISSFNS